METLALLGLPSWEFFKPFIVTGLALGGVYAVSGVGMVVLYRTTGVLNLAFGAVGAMGAFIAWQLIESTTLPHWVAYLSCIGFGGSSRCCTACCSALPWRGATRSPKRSPRSASP